MQTTRYMFKERLIMEQLIFILAGPARASDQILLQLNLDTVLSFALIWIPLTHKSS